MAGLEKSGNEILLEQLTKRVAQLASEQKAKEAIVKELNEQIKIAERESVAKIEKARADTEKEVDSLKIAVAPLHERLVTCEQLRRDIEELKREKIESVTYVKEAKSGAIKEADTVIAISAARLAKIEAAISECKAKVASL